MSATDMSFGDKLTENVAEHLSKEVYDTIMEYYKRAKEADARAEKTKEEVKDEVLNEYELENAELRERLRLSVASLNSEEEMRMYTNFCNSHMKCRTKYKVDGGKMPYVVQYQTGVGVCTKVYCQACGESEDITDTSIW